MLQKKYKMIDDPPRIIGWDTYAIEIEDEYRELNIHADDESAFQRFFERNPSFMPGAFELFGTSGHYPYSQGLLSEPEIDNGLFRRIPDFIWLAQDSLNFTPILIEIEKPSKKTFTQSGVQTAEFSQALGQVLEWKAILKEPENILMFYKYFSIPDWVREKTFAPQFGLIYGRRSEYENNTQLRKKRAELTPDNVLLMSYDRLHPLADSRHLLCCKVKQGRYKVITIPPTYQYSPSTASNLKLMDGFCDAIPKMEKTSEERKEFLATRYSYWMEYGQLNNKGIINSSDVE